MNQNLLVILVYHHLVVHTHNVISSEKHQHALANQDISVGHQTVVQSVCTMKNVQVILRVFGKNAVIRVKVRVVRTQSALL